MMVIDGRFILSWTPFRCLPITSWQPDCREAVSVNASNTRITTRARSRTISVRHMPHARYRYPCSLCMICVLPDLAQQMLPRQSPHLFSRSKGACHIKEEWEMWTGAYRAQHGLRSHKRSGFGSGLWDVERVQRWGLQAPDHADEREEIWWLGDQDDAGRR